MSAMVTCLSLWVAANRGACSAFITVPSSFISSLMTPTGGSPLSLQRSTAASVWPERSSTPPSRAISGNTWAGPREIVGAGIGIGQRAAAGGAFVGRNAGAAVGLVVDRHRKGGGVVGFVVCHHRIEPQPARIFGCDRRADNARGVADDERHLVGRAQRRRDDQIALALAVLVIGNDDEFAMGEGVQHFLDRIGHSLRSRFV